MAGSMTQKIYDSLRNEYNRAENELKSVDKNLKKLTGGSEIFTEKSPNLARSKSGRNYFDEKRYTSIRSNDINRKRRLSPPSSRIFSRLDKRLDDDSDRKRPSLQSTIVPANQGNDVIKLKEENVVKENKESDKKNVARNRRMFGMIMGTLQKFQSEETQRKIVTTKREEIEKKLDQADAEEKEAVKQEKLLLIKSKRDKQTQLKDIETKMERVEIHQQWEKSNQYLANFIQTKTKPHIFYMPNKLTPETEKRLKETKNKYLIILAEKRAKIQKEIEDLNKKDEEMRNELQKNDFDEKTADKEKNKQVKNGFLENDQSSSNSKDIKSKENKRMKFDRDDLKNEEHILKENKIESDESNIDAREKSVEKSNGGTEKSGELNIVNENTDEMCDDQSNLVEQKEQTNKIQDQDLRPIQLKFVEKTLDDKEFEPIYDE